MIKKDIVEMVKGELKLSTKECEAAVEAVLNAIVDGLLLHGDVRLRGFGTFAVKKLSPKTITTPFLDKPCQIPARNRITFRASRAIVGLDSIL